MSNGTKQRRQRIYIFAPIAAGPGQRGFSKADARPQALGSGWKHPRRSRAQAAPHPGSVRESEGEYPPIARDVEPARSGKDGHEMPLARK
jgi:hypothetical protein